MKKVPCIDVPLAERKVYLVGHQAIDDDALAAFLADEGVSRWDTDTDDAGEKLVEVAGRLCYESYARPRPGGNKAYIDHILDVGHGSVLEHSTYNFIITGVSRSFTHELIRHRAGAGYSQQSQRFVDMETSRFVVPPLIERYAASMPAIPIAWNAAIEAARKAYGRLDDLLLEAVCMEHLFREHPTHEFCGAQAVLDGCDRDTRTRLKKQAREAARSVLPNATETKIFVTLNARAARHFLEMRGDPVADAEIRSVAIDMLEILRGRSANAFGDMEVVERDGVSCIKSKHKKV
jgi:thymidylate synthase (FAD)